MADEKIPCNIPSELEIKNRDGLAMFFADGELLFSMHHEQLSVLKRKVEDIFMEMTSND